jgi:all-trans-retinol dehydrogenase (NAD+)
MGRLTAGKFAADGARLALLDIRPDDLAAAVAEIVAKGGTAKGYVCDLTKREEIYATFRQIEQDFGPVDVLFNNAGVAYAGPLAEADDEKLDATIAVNLTAHLWTMKAVLPGMIRRGAGHIINFSSAAGLLGVPRLAAYCASKFGVIGMTEAMRLEMHELGHQGIKFTIIAPSYVATGMFDGATPPLLAPWLRPEDMAERIHQAVRRDKYFVCAPWIVNTIPAAKALLPFGAVRLLAAVLRMGKSMQGWTGRKNELPGGAAGSV